LKEEAPDRSLWRTSFGRVCGTLVRQIIEWMVEYTNEWENEWMNEWTKGLHIPVFFGAKTCWLANTVNWGWVKLTGKDAERGDGWFILRAVLIFAWDFWNIKGQVTFSVRDVCLFLT
jgi:hypothetical protein